ncbi:MAG: flagella accessory protein C [Thermoplasmataceae archaeon]
MKRGKKETTATNETIYKNQPQQIPGADAGQVQSENDKFVESVNQRIANLENDLGKLNTTTDSLKRNIGEIRTELEAMKENVKLVVSLYEMVSKDFNPFMDTTPEEIKAITDKMREDMDEMNRKITSAIDDLGELYGTPNLDAIISETSGGETSDQ